MVQTLTLSLCLFAAWLSFPQNSTSVIVLEEAQLRSRATSAVLPKYPTEASKSSGVVVSRIEFDTNGIVTSADIIETADESFVAPTLKALKQWRFKPLLLSGGEARRGKGKITFYCFWKNGRGWCADPVIFSKESPMRTR
jgi:TonB family protein